MTFAAHAAAYQPAGTGIAYRIEGVRPRHGTARAALRKTGPLPSPVQMVGFPSDGGLMAGGVSATTTRVCRRYGAASTSSPTASASSSGASGRAPSTWSRHGWWSGPRRPAPGANGCRSSSRRWPCTTGRRCSRSARYDSEGVPQELLPLDPNLVQPILTDTWGIAPPERVLHRGDEGRCRASWSSCAARPSRASADEIVRASSASPG